MAVGSWTNPAPRMTRGVRLRGKPSPWLTTLDRVADLRFARFTGPGGTLGPQRERPPTGIDIDVHLIGSESLLDPYGDWAAVHVAWRADRIDGGSADTFAVALWHILRIATSAPSTSPAA